MFGQPAPGLRAQASSAKQPPVWAWGRLPAQSQPGLLRAQGSGPEDGQRWPRGHLHPQPRARLWSTAWCTAGAQPRGLQVPGSTGCRTALAPRPAACLLPPPDKRVVPVTVAVTGCLWPRPGSQLGVGPWKESDQVAVMAPRGQGSLSTRQRGLWVVWAVTATSLGPRTPC